MVRMMMLGTPSFRAVFVESEILCVLRPTRYAILPFERDEFRNHGVSMMSMQETFMQSNPNKYANVGYLYHVYDRDFDVNNGHIRYF